MNDRHGAGWQKEVAPPKPGGRPSGLPLKPEQVRAREAVREAARAVVSAYEGVTTSGDWMTLVMPIVRLRAELNQEADAR